MRSGIHSGRLLAEIPKNTLQVLSVHSAMRLCGLRSGIALPSRYHVIEANRSIATSTSHVYTRKMVMRPSQGGCNGATKTYLRLKSIGISVCLQLTGSVLPCVRILEIRMSHTEIVVHIEIGKKSANDEVALIVPQHAKQIAPRSVVEWFAAFHVRAKSVGLRRKRQIMRISPQPPVHDRPITLKRKISCSALMICISSPV